MFIAKELKNKNIAEYVLYMWQIEDLMRAYGFDIEKINEQIIAPYNLSEDDKKTMYEWYESLIDMMRSENIKEKGHLQLNKNVIIQLNDFHLEFMKSGKDASYNAAFYRVLPALSQLRLKQDEANLTDIELCFNFLYGIMFLRLQKKEITPETQEVQTNVSGFLALLNKYYQLYSRGELSFDEDYE